MRLDFDDRFRKELPADPNEENSRRQVSGALFSYVTPRVPTSPKVLHVAREVAELVGLTEQQVASDSFCDLFSGKQVAEGTRPYAMAYGGHQFGSWAGQLGDGRAINLFEVRHRDQLWTLQLKGAGATPYSRMGDGLAVLRSSVREHLCSEAMFHLGVPTSRSLCLLTTGDEVMRDVMYDGHAAMEPGAVVCRVAPSFIRFGNFELLSSRGEIELLKKLADYTIRHFYPDCRDGETEPYGKFFQAVCQRSLQMVLGWQRVGFVHGVMNTDNMSIHGETIDYGPYGWLEGYDPGWTPNTTDRAQRRYRYGNQVEIVFWNLIKLANALYPLVEDAAPFEAALEEFQNDFRTQDLAMRARKLGILDPEPSDEALLTVLETTLQETETDMTLFYRLLANVSPDQTNLQGDDFLAPVYEAFYHPDELVGEVLQRWRDWFEMYFYRLNQSTTSDQQRRQEMNQVNPKYVLRNYMAQLAIDAAEGGDHSVIEEIAEVLRQPYSENPQYEKWFAKRPEWARHKVGCSMLSCSS